MEKVIEIVLTVRKECPGFYHPKIYVLDDKSVDIWYKEGDFELLINVDDTGDWGCYGDNYGDVKVEVDNDLDAVIKFLKKIRS